jgi:hypothetical protein
VSRELARRSTAVVAVIAIALVCGSPASARASSSPLACTTAFPDAHTKSIGETTWYNRQSSVENVVCGGFGLQPNVGVACSRASALLEKVVAPAGLLGTHFRSRWLAVTCDPSDLAFATLPRNLGTISVTRSDALGGYTATLNGHLLPPYVAAARAYLGRPSSVKRVGFKRDPECRLSWPAEHLTADFYHGYGGVLDSCAPRAGTLRVEFGRGWSTDKGVAVGGTVAELRRAYPRATVHGSTWILIGSPTPWNSTIMVLGAEVDGGRVATLIVAGPEAWDE